MPTYEYECQLCKLDFEAFQSMKDDAFKTCPEGKCRQEVWGHGEVKRKIGAGAGFIFKGGGFYITDYRSEGYKSKEKSDKSATSPTAPPTAVSAPAPAATPKAAAKSDT